MKLINIIITLIYLACINPVYADDKHHFPMDLNDLGLSKQQHHSVEEAMKEYQLSYRRYHHQSEKTQEELNLLFVGSSFDSEMFRAKSLEMEKASIEIRARLFERLHTILTPEQKRRFIRHMVEWDIE
jgi:Spy/CpxP family protein refolding chaperone